MNAPLENPQAPVIGKLESGKFLRRLIYGVIIVGVLILAILSAAGRFSMMMDIHDWMFGR